MKTYEQRVRNVLEDQPGLSGIILPLLHLRTEALRQAAALTKLEEHLEEEGCLDRRSTMTQEQVFEAVLEAVASDLKTGLLDPAQVEALVSRLNYG